jgi:hypothetical protein
MSTLFLRSAAAAVAFASIASAQFVLPSGTRISARLDQTISSATAEQGQPVQLSVTDAVKVNGIVVIPQGAPVLGTIVLAQEKRNMGRTGKLDFSVDKVRAADGEYIPLRYTMQKREGGSKGVSTGIMTAGAAVLFWPAAPFFLLRKGKDVTINRGMTFEVFTDQDHAVAGQQQLVSGGPAMYHAAPAQQMQPAYSLQQAAAPPAPMQPVLPVQAQPPVQQAQAQPAVQYANMPRSTPQSSATVELATLNITADLQGSEVDIDGAFVGSTPGKAKLAPGVHKITVRNGVNVWSRDLTVQPGASVNVHAIFRK